MSRCNRCPVRPRRRAPGGAPQCRRRQPAARRRRGAPSVPRATSEPLRRRPLRSARCAGSTYRRSPAFFRRPTPPASLFEALLVLLLAAVGRLAALGRLASRCRGRFLAVVVGGGGRRLRRVARALVQDDRLGDARLAQQVARTRQAHRLLVTLDLLVELLDAFLAVLGAETPEREQDRLVDRVALRDHRRDRLHRTEQDRQTFLRVARERDREGSLLRPLPERVVQLLAI